MRSFLFFVIWGIWKTASFCSQDVCLHKGEGFERDISPHLYTLNSTPFYSAWPPDLGEGGGKTAWANLHSLFIKLNKLYGKEKVGCGWRCIPTEGFSEEVSLKLTVYNLDRENSKCWRMLFNVTRSLGEAWQMMLDKKWESFLWWF